MNKTTFLIPCWNSSNRYINLKNQLIEQGVSERNIILCHEKKSRSLIVNKYIRDINTEYIGLCDDDVIISDNAVATLETVLDKYPKVGLALAPSLQQKILCKPIPTLAPSDSDDKSIENTSSKMWSFNFTLMRNSCGIFLDEDIFGGQLIDWDLGLEFLYQGYFSVIDHRCAVSHQKTEFHNKSLAYHAVVARNRHIFMTKWRNRSVWTNLDDYNAKNNNVIPTLEEVTHASEKWLFDYISKFDQAGLVDCWFKPRFGNEASLNFFISEFNEKYITQNNQIFNPQIIKPDLLPVFLI